MKCEIERVKLKLVQMQKVGNGILITLYPRLENPVNLYSWIDPAFPKRLSVT